MKDTKNLEKMTTAQLLRIVRTSSNDLEVSRASAIVQKRKGSKYPVALASLLSGL